MPTFVGILRYMTNTNAIVCCSEDDVVYLFSLVCMGHMPFVTGLTNMSQWPLHQEAKCHFVTWKLSLHVFSSLLPLSKMQITYRLHGVSRERSGSVVECLTRDRRAAGSSLTALWSLSKTHLL